jgi:hypothetical protein
MISLTFEGEFQPYISQQGASDLPQASWSGKGYARYTPTVAQLLTGAVAAGTALPSDARHAIISVKDGGIRVRTDGTNPTSTEGLYVPAGTIITFANKRQTLLQWRFINASGEVSEVTAAWFA